MKCCGVFLSLVCVAMAGCSADQDNPFRAAVAEAKSGKSNVVDIRESPLSDDSLLRELAGIQNLQMLNLDRSPVTDAGIAAIGRLPELKSLSLTRTRISAKAVAMIMEQFPGLLYLRLDETTVGAGISALSQSKNLRQLSLYRVPVTSPMCRELAKITTLNDLSLDQTMITDDGLVALAGLDNLERLSIWQCQVSDKAVEKFSQKRPDVHVNR